MVLFFFPVCVSRRLQSTFWDQCWAEGSCARCHRGADQQNAPEVPKVTLRNSKPDKVPLPFLSPCLILTTQHGFGGVCHLKTRGNITAKRPCRVSAASHDFILQFQKCDEIIVLHLGYLNYPLYRVMVSFKGLEMITSDIHVKFVVSYSRRQCWLSSCNRFWDVSFISSEVLTVLFWFDACLSGKHITRPFHKWRSGSVLSLSCWLLW